jgi:hypothetical protein
LSPTEKQILHCAQDDNVVPRDDDKVDARTTSSVRR